MKRAFLWVLVLAAGTVADPASAFDSVDPATAYAMATSNPKVFILDVRTPEEWLWVGHPGKNAAGEGAALDGKVVNISWEKEKKGALILNPSFLTDVAEAFADDPSIVLLLMCRSGKRSAAAAAALEAAGYSVLNVATGFEGAVDSRGYRTVNGWKVLGLPYTYSGAAYPD